MSKKRRGRGEGAIEKLPDGRFRAVLSLGINPKTGKRIRRKYYANTKVEALAKLREAQAAHAKGKLVDAGSLTVADWLEQWLRVQKPKVAPKTYHGWESLHRRHLKPAFETQQLRGLLLRKIQPLHVESLYSILAEGGVSGSEQRKTGSVLTMALKHAVRMRLIHTNPAAEVSKPKTPKPQLSVWEGGQVRAFLASALKDRLYAMYVTALDSAARPGELFALVWPDVDWVRNAVSITKSLEDIDGQLRVKDVKTPKSRRILTLAKHTMGCLAAHRERMRVEGQDVDSGIIFCDRDGGYLRGQNLLRRSFRPAQQRAGVPAIRMYDLRHTAATLLLAAGVNVKVVSERLGHADIQTTLNHYIHVMQSMQGLAADAFDLLMSYPPDGPQVPKVDGQ